MSVPPFSANCPLFFIMNAGSGHNDKAQTQETIEEVMRVAGRPYEICLVDKPSMLTDTARKAVEKALACGGAVVAVGGDGTLNAVANVVVGSGCVFGALPQGTFNYFGRTHGLSQDGREAAEALLRATPHPVQVGMLNERIFLVNASLGLYPQVLEDREAYKQHYGRSRLVAAWSGLVSVFQGHRQLRITLDSQGRTSTLRTPTLFVGNNRLQLEQIGIPESEVIEEGQLAAIAVKPVGTLSLLWLMLCGAFGRLGEAENVINFSFSRLTVKPSKLYRTQRVKVAMDGEISWMNTPLNFRVSPDPLYLLKPQATTPDGREATP
ncbi:diacylglycerol kinase family protein [uncultured Oxalicibacterium sp.]|uniref:diacylglycerol/lipid kinase family protein n=1 Tax=uncultured Oxalicibacterium sp. TaxID=1168540 RepID=UPI0025EBF22B|nr:diacylglycerol kinase family protein [uncultured Oxalicibacterium sp.]